jgi:hypothetical protein
MNYTCKKQWEGKVSVRSYIVEYCKKMKEPLILEFAGKKMKVKDLKDYTCDKHPFIAQRSDNFIKKGSVYNLYDYNFIPQEDVKPAEDWKMEGLKKALLAWKNSKKPKQMKVGDLQ